MTYLLLTMIAVLPLARQDNFGEIVTSRSAHSYSQDQGVCALALQSNANGPLAIYGIYKLKGDSARFGYLVLFKPGADRDKPCQIKKNFETQVTTQSSTDIKGEVKWTNTP